MLENIHELKQSCEKISDKFPCAEIKLFQTDVDKGWSNLEVSYISHVTTVLHHCAYNFINTEIEM